MAKTKKYGFLALVTLVLVMVAWAVKQNSVEPVLHGDISQASPELATVPVDNELVSQPATTEVAAIPNADTAELNLQQIDSNKNIAIETVDISALETDDEAMIAAIEKDMQLTLPPEGDLSYMSPENETVQPINPIFPAVAPDDPNAKLGEEADKNQKLGFPFTEEPKQ